jgi:hypothetical protein
LNPRPFGPAIIDGIRESTHTLSWRLRPLGHLSIESNWFDEVFLDFTIIVASTNDSIRKSGDDVI